MYHHPKVYFLRPPSGDQTVQNQATNETSESQVNGQNPDLCVMYHHPKSLIRLARLAYFSRSHWLARREFS